MKLQRILLLLVVLVTFASCEIVQETRFSADGSGTYSLGLDMSEMMKSSGLKSDTKNEQLDTIFKFADIIALKKDSIATLSKKEQQKIKQLEAFTLYIKSDTIAKKMLMRINYAFNDLDDLKLFGKKLKDQNFKELTAFTNKTIGKDAKGDGIPDFNTLYDMKYSAKKFSIKITKKALNDALKKRDTTLTKDNPMENMIRFKTRYIFPYRIKKVTNENARILSDFKGIEISANLYEVNNHPDFFDFEVFFE